MSFSEKFVKSAQYLLPSPFTIAILLSAFTVLMALVFTEPVNQEQAHILQLFGYWEAGFFSFLKFAMQMMMILVLGHVLALTKPIDSILQGLVKYCNTTARAAAIVCFVSVLIAFFNWGLALVAGAVFARKVGDYAVKHQLSINYPLIGAAGYTGLMVWHGGISGSAPLKVAEPGHKFEESIGLISFSDTVFSSMNILCAVLLLTILPLALYFLGKRSSTSTVALPKALEVAQSTTTEEIEGAERLDHSRLMAVALGGVMLFLAIYKLYLNPTSLKGLQFITPNYIIFILFALAVLLHGSFQQFNQSVTQAISGSTGIMIQFPLYAGIMGIMMNSGLVDVISELFVQVSNSTTLPIYTFFSAGLVNIFVPSGGGQWLVQGPILIEASQSLNVPMEKSIMALCYGDQITNMLQPFWALPLLGITGLKAKDILPYTAFLFLVGMLIFCTVLLIF